MKQIKLEKVYRIAQYEYPKGYILFEKDATAFEKWDIVIAEDPFKPHLTIYLRRGEFSYTEMDLSPLYNHAIVLGYKGPVELFITGYNKITELKYKRLGEFDPLYTMDDLLSSYVYNSDKVSQGDKKHEVIADTDYRRYSFLEGLKKIVDLYNATHLST